MEIYRTKVDFLSVYISEAHACDEWPLGQFVCIPQHKTLEQRMDAAKKYLRETQCKAPMVVDLLEDNFNQLFAAWPERGFILHKGNIVYISDAKLDGTIDWEEGIESWLQDNII